MNPHPNFPLGMLAGEFYDKGRKLVLLRPLRFVDYEYGVDVTADAGETTDFNSTPRLVWSIFPPWQFAEAGALHDAVFRNPPDGWTRQNCDWLHWRILRLTGCGKVKAELTFQALSRGSKGAWNRYREAEIHG